MQQVQLVTVFYLLELNSVLTKQCRSFSMLRVELPKY